MIQFVDRPCGWNPSEPASLREMATDGRSDWQGYSTARYFEGQEPVVLDTIHHSGPTSLDSGIQVELLSRKVAKRWREVDIELAAEVDIDHSQFSKLLLEALDLVRTVLPLYGTVAGLCRSLHLLVPPGRGFDTSYSDPSLPFSVFVSCPEESESDRVERFAENVVHEALHLQLTLVERSQPLISGTPCEQTFFSPWRSSWRDVRGVIHAVYVFSNLRHFWNHVAAQGSESSTFARLRVEVINQELDAARHLAASPFLTEMGRRLVESHMVVS